MSKGRKNLNSRMVWLDCLRLAASLSMVGLHASSDITGQPFPDFDVADRVGPVLFRSVVYLARTELFLLISVFLLLKTLIALVLTSLTVIVLSRLPLLAWTVGMGRLPFHMPLMSCLGTPNFNPKLS